ncbi:PREDICTED: uncharacterized protein LOC106814532 [Priapulus caudatus]|uniref:Uncharacterized protein LOC106814532 n=1 Tax=Priapulus caudatus TaxID=37621 RepID=A0ABM1EQ62_PRICU|nr:PREDICTED: uncharacterized protein LOC106814532 [Priapulus caudatus]
MDCPFSVTIRPTSDGEKLLVKTVKSEHNHENSEASFMHLPKQRRLDGELMESTCQMLHMKANKKILQDHIHNVSGKKVLLKDLHNIGTSNRPHHENNFENLLAEMQKYKDATVEVCIDENSVLQAIYFQTREMQQSFEAYPELLFLDATYKLNDLRMPLYVLMTEDGNGESEIVCLWLVVREDHVTIQKMVEIFKQANPSWDMVEVIMSDKDMVERDVLREQFPDATMQICLFHTLKSMRREISAEKLGISQAERNTALEILQRIVYAKTEAEYDALYNQLKATSPKSVVDYFNKNWHAIRKEWADGLKNGVCHFQNRTNNRLESTNQKIKSVVSRYSGIKQFFIDLMKCIKCLKTERDHRALDAVMKTPLVGQEQEPVSAAQQYQKLLTPYAFAFVQKQLKLQDKCTISKNVEDGVEFTRQSGSICVKIDYCPCGLQAAMKLPCCHVLAARQHKGVPVYCEDLCANRWRLDYFKGRQRVFSAFEDDTAEDTTSNGAACHQLPRRTGRILTEQEKYREGSSVAQDLAQQLSSFGSDDFRYNLGVLKVINQMWREGKKIAVAEFSCTNAECYDDNNSNNATESDHRREPGPGNGGVDLGTPNLEFDCSNEGSASGLDKTNNSNTEIVTQSDEVPFENDGLNIRCIKMPPKMLKRGRPKGAGLTTIGIPKKNGSSKKPASFVKKSGLEKEKIILSWFVEDNIVEKAVHDEQLIEENHVECRPEKIHEGCLDKSVDLYMVRHHFSTDAWHLVMQVFQLKQQVHEWVCKVCQHDLSECESIMCDCCLQWYHIKCVGLKAVPKAKHWMCRFCYRH